MDNLTTIQEYTEAREMRHAASIYARRAEEALQRIIALSQTAQDPYRAYDVMQAICSSLNVAEMAITEGSTKREG